MRYLSAGVVFLLITMLVFCGFTSSSKNLFGARNYADSTYKNYLALGDSYTIGQSVEAAENFPNQLVTGLQAKGIKVNAPEIRAVTGWTTGDLIASLRTSAPALPRYDLVTLLIGVNNQFQGRTMTEYQIEFRFLLNEAITFAGDKKRVLVVSIPDYSVTPFVAGQETTEISKEVAQYNALQKKIAAEAGVQFINITPISKQGKKDDSLQAEDGLHPSGKQYEKWVNLLIPKAIQILK